MSLNESIVEDAVLEWFRELGYICLGAEALTPTLSHGKRGSYGEVVLVGRLREAIRRLTPAISEEPSGCALHADRRATGKRYLQVRFERGRSS